MMVDTSKPETSFPQAMADAIHACMSEIDQFSMVGGEMFGLSAHNQLLERLREDFPGRLSYPPISEQAFTAIGIGAAMVGERVLVDLGSPAGAFLAMTQIINEAGNAFSMSNGQLRVPVVFHMMHGLRGSGAEQHSHSPQAMIWNAPGIEIVLPSSPRDAKGLLISAIKSDNPTMFLSHRQLLSLSEPVPAESFEIPLGQADIKREGGDLTIVATSRMVQLALEAAEELAGEGVNAEVVDPRTLVPFDKQTILNSVAKTGRLIIADETNHTCGVAAEISATVAEEGFEFLKKPIIRIDRPNVPVPASPHLEAAITPNSEKIVAAAKRIIA